MAGIKAFSWLSFACIFFNVHGGEAQDSGLSAVIETQQELNGYYDSIKNWVHSGRPGLFMSDDFDQTENSTFHIKTAGVYYVSANLIIETRSSNYRYYYYRRGSVTFQGEIHLSSDNGYVSYNKHLSTYVTMRKYEQKNLRISGYIQMDEGWKVNVQLGYRYGWKRIIKAGSTLSLTYVSKPAMFPGVLLKNDYEYLYMESPSYSANVVDWNEIDEGSAFPESEGNIMIPHNGLYHILVNLNIRRYTDITIDFSIMINNETEAISRRTKIESQGRTTIILEGILNLQEKQIISIRISNPDSYYAYIRVDSSSTFFIFSKGALNVFNPALSTHYKSSSTKLPANKFSRLKNWDTTSTPSLDHYSNVQLDQGEFVASKSGIYQVNMALYLSNCTRAVARISRVNTSNVQCAISPDIGLMNESSDCYLENSLILKLATNDKLRLEVKSDVKYTVLPHTSYQVIFQTKHILWPAAIFKLTESFQFKTNSAAAKVGDWSHHMEGNWNDLFFKINKEKIVIPHTGLYLLSYNAIVKTTTSGAQFHSEIIINGTKAVQGSTCQRASVTSMSTCTTSMLINLNEETNLALHVLMKDSSKKKQSVEITNSSRLTIISLGDTRSHPSFKLNVKAKTYSVKAPSTDKMQSLTEYTLPNTSYFQSAPIYSSKAKTFHGGENIGFLLLNNIQFDLQNDGCLASVVGSESSNMMVYSNDHKQSRFSLSAADVTLDPQFYFNVSTTAKTGLKWNAEAGSVTSGVYIDHKETMIYLKAQLKPKTKSYCSNQWTQIALTNWHVLAHLNNLGKINANGMQLSRSGFFLTSLNFAVTSNSSSVVIDVAIFVEKNILLSASETSPADGRFSVFLQGVVEGVSGQNIEVKMKCSEPTMFTHANGGGISVVKVDELQSSPGMRKRFNEEYIYSDEIGYFYPRYSYNSDETFEEFRQGISNNDQWKLSVARNGVYFISAVGYAHTRSYSTGENFELGFSSQANISENTACSLDSSPLFFKDSSNRMDESLALSGFVSLDKNEVAGFLGRYDYYSVSYTSRFYMSLQFLGDIETSDSFIANLQKDTTVPKGENKPFKGAWISGKTCGHFRTRDIPSQIQKYKVSYSGYYMVAINWVLKHKDGSNFGFCFTVNGKIISVGVDNVGCFVRHLKTENHTSVSTVSNSELLYLEEEQELSVQMSTSLEISILKRSSFSVFYLGTAGSILGTSWVIKKAELKELPSFSLLYHYHYHYHYHYYDDDREYAQHLVKGWQASVANTKMFFHNGVKTIVKDMFVASQDGVYLVLVKLHVKGKHAINETCGVKLQLAVDGEVLDFAFKDDITGTRNTLSFTTTLRLEKWQGVTVRVSWGLSQCTNMGVEPGSSFSVLYLDSGKKAFTLWPNIGPHIVEFPEERLVYVREDKDETRVLTCTAVGKYPITYEWQTFSKVVSESSTLDTTMLNRSQSVKCVANMQGLIAESMFITVRAIDPTIIFSDTYNNRTYDLPEMNETTTDGYKDVLIFGAREKNPGYYYWHWSRRINCSITGGNINNTFMIRYRYYYYGWGDDDQYFTLQARFLNLDREKTPDYKIQITCKNLEYSDAVPATTTIDIKVLDANDNLPVFEKEIYKAKIPRSIHAGDNILQVMATDDDINENGKIKYSLVYTSDSYIFSIDENYGVISLKQHEILSRPTYTLTVEAKDQGKSPRSAYVTVILQVQDATTPSTNQTNTNPVFPQQKYIAYLIPGTPKGTVVTTVHAHDPFTFGHDNIRYYLFRGDHSVFKVDSKSGEITTKGEVIKAQYVLEVAAEYIFKPGQKPGQYYNTTLVIVLLRPVDTSLPNFEKPVYKVQIPENKSINSQIVRVRADYKKPLVYTNLVPQTLFKLDSKTGAITLTGKLDYEKLKVYVLVVKAYNPAETDKMGLTTVIINVIDINDNVPVIEDYPKDVIHVNMIKESPFKIGHVKATDKDSGSNSVIRYYLKYDYNAFSINAENGTLYVRGHLKCCDIRYNLTVQATDQGIPPKHDEVTLLVSPFYPKPDPTHNAHHGSKSSSDQTKYIIAGVAGGLVIIIILVGVVYWRRRRNQRNSAASAMNYMSLPSDEDDELLDAASDNEDNDNNGRLSLISAASDDNLLRNEEPC